MSPADEIRLRQMLEAAEKSIGLADGSARDKLVSDDRLSLAIVRLLEVCGQAAKGVSPDVQTGNPYIPWMAIGRMRDRLVHAKLNVDHDITWEIIARDMPVVVTELKRMLAPAKK